jgi:hypothetical protein
MQPIPPFWFVQRQAKAEPAGDNLCRATAPNLREAFLAIRQGVEGRWSAALRLAAEGSDVATTPALYDNPGDAWGAAFELYRNHVVIGQGEAPRE